MYKKFLAILLTIVVVLCLLCVLSPKPGVVVFGSYREHGNTMYQVNDISVTKDTIAFSEEKQRLDFSYGGNQMIVNSEAGHYNDSKLNVPLIMLLDPRSRFGCPDCHDQGGYYLQFTLFGITRSFKIDKGSEPFYFPGLTKKIVIAMEKADN